MAYRFCSVCHDHRRIEQPSMQYPSALMRAQLGYIAPQPTNQISPNNNNYNSADNYICPKCLEEFKSVKITINKLIPQGKLCMTLKDVLGWVLESDTEVKAQTEKLKFLAPPAYGDVLASSDLLVHPGDNIGPPIRAHKVILATRSKIFDTVTPDSSQSITLPEITNHEELESLLEFLYHGELPEERWSKHIYSLTLAAQKYKIPYLEELCGRYLNLSNVLDVLELADSRASKRLKMNALEYIAEHKLEVVSSNKFDSFAIKHPHLCLQILKDSLFKSGSEGRQ